VRRLGERADVVTTGETTVNLDVALETLREKYTIRHLLCEGGPELAHELLSAGLLDEVFLTLAPKLGSDRHALRLLEGTPFPEDTLPKLELVHVFAQASELFLRYRIV
jgi:riboflavin biosynthesis pyrimidine reductase